MGKKKGFFSNDMLKTFEGKIFARPSSKRKGYIEYITGRRKIEELRKKGVKDILCSIVQFDDTETFIVALLDQLKEFFMEEDGLTEMEALKKANMAMDSIEDLLETTLGLEAS